MLLDGLTRSNNFRGFENIDNGTKVVVAEVPANVFATIDAAAKSSEALPASVARPVAFATAHVAAQFVKNFPRDDSGVFAPESLPVDIRREILAGVRSQGLKILHKVTILKTSEDEEEV